MAHQDATSKGKELISKTRRSSSSKLQSSLSQPEPPRHLTLPTSANNNYPQSPAELYILSRSQMPSTPIEPQRLSPSSPAELYILSRAQMSSTSNEPQRLSPSSPSATNIGSTLSPMGYDERMNIWRQKEATKICKKHKTRYVYDPPPSSQPPVTSTRTVKADNLRKRATSKESRDISKMSSDV